MKKNHIIIIAIVAVIMVVMIAISFIGPKEPEVPTITDIFQEGTSINSGTFEVTINLANSENAEPDSDFKNLTIKLNGTTDGTKTLFGVNLDTGANKITMNDLVFINNENIYINSNSLLNIQGKTTALGDKNEFNKWILLNSAEISETSAYKELQTLFNQILIDTMNKNTFVINNGAYIIDLNNETLSLICNSIADSLEVNIEQWKITLDKAFNSSVDIPDEILNAITIEETTTKNEEIIIENETIITEENSEKNNIELETDSIETFVNEEIINEDVSLNENETTNEKSTKVSSQAESNVEISTVLSENTEKNNDNKKSSIKNEEITIAEEITTTEETTVVEETTIEETIIETTTAVETTIEETTTTEETTKTETNDNKTDFSFDLLNSSNEEKINAIITFLRKLANDLVNESDIYTGTYSTSIANDTARIFTQNFSLKCNENTINEYSITISTIFTENNNIELTELNSDKIFTNKESSSIFLKFIKYLTTNGESLFIPNYIETQSLGRAYKNPIGVIWEEKNDVYEKRIIFATSAGVVSNIYYSISTKDSLVADCFYYYYFTNGTTHYTKDYIASTQDKISQKRLSELSFIYNNYDNNANFVLIQADDGLINEYSKLAKNEKQLIAYLQENFS